MAIEEIDTAVQEALRYLGRPLSTVEITKYKVAVHLYDGGAVEFSYSKPTSRREIVGALVCALMDREVWLSQNK